MDNFSMPATNLSPGRYFVTTNYMMSEEHINQYYDARVTGGKPAAASSVDRSMVCTAEVGNSRYLLVVMSAQSQVSENGLSVISFGNFVETKKLMNFAFNGFTVRQVLGKSQALCQYAVKNGSNDVVAHPAEDVWVLLPSNYNKDLVQYQNIVEASSLRAPVAVSDKLGVLQIRYGNLILANCDLLAMNPVEERIEPLGTAERIPVETGKTAQQWEALLPIIGLVAIVLAFVALIVLLIVKLLRNLRIRRQMSYRIRKRKRGR
jgi:D-alanyl-D-alanine carboxypeptidase